MSSRTVCRNTLATAISFTVGVSTVCEAKTPAPVPLPLSNEFSFVNARGKHSATDGSGLFISVWNEGPNIYARYTRSGAVSGDSFLIASNFVGTNLSVSMNSHGDAVVAWDGEEGITAQIVPANSTLIAPRPIPVGTGNTGPVSVAMSDDGDFVVGWTGEYAIAPPDTDGDGYYDFDDKCPIEGDTGFGLVSEGDRVGCPLGGPDSDGDFVIDSEDYCPTYGDNGYGVDIQGCPLPDPNLDSDDDGVIDTQDSCLLVGDTGYGVYDNGCPIPDTDLDGFPDPDDHCPTQGENLIGLDDYGCPIPDTDGDGVGDPDDVCPADGLGAFGVDDEGCQLPGPDGDGDDVVDSLDLCPTLGDDGFGVDVNGCPLPDPDLDTDEDGVIDTEDLCPTEGEGEFGVDRHGCQLHEEDSDEDGIIDTEDRCPTEGDAGFDIDAQGCPLPNPDTDEDGFENIDDACPLAGESIFGIDDFGCPLAGFDEDGDGLFDENDLCPADGDEGFGIDSDGCPLRDPSLDSDFDGILDVSDACPTRGDEGYGIDGDGCPMPPPLLFKATSLATPEDNVLIRAFTAQGLPTSDRPTPLAENCIPRSYGYGGYYGYTPGCSMDIAISKNGSHAAVVWTGDKKVIARRFNPKNANLTGLDIAVDATPPSVGAITQVGDKSITVSPAAPSVAMDESGNFTVAWSRITTSTQRQNVCLGKGADRYCEERDISSTVASIMMQRFNANDFPEHVGKKGKVDIVVQKGKKYSNHLFPQVSVSRSGNVAIGWENLILKKTKIIPDPEYAKYFYSYDFNASGIKAVRYSATSGPLKKLGAPVTTAKAVIKQPTKAQAVIDNNIAPSVALDDNGNLQVLWANQTRTVYPDPGGYGANIIKAVFYPAK